MATLETTIKGGLPITVEYEMAGADTSVGIMSSYCDGWSIVKIGKNKCKTNPEKWLKLTREDEREIQRQCEEHNDSQNREYFVEPEHYYD